MDNQKCWSGHAGQVVSSVKTLRADWKRNRHNASVRYTLLYKANIMWAMTSKRSQAPSSASLTKLERRFQKIILWNPVPKLCGFRDASAPLSHKRKADKNATNVFSFDPWWASTTSGLSEVQTYEFEMAVTHTLLFLNRPEIKKTALKKKTVLCEQPKGLTGSSFHTYVYINTDIFPNSEQTICTFRTSNIERCAVTS